MIYHHWPLGLPTCIYHAQMKFQMRDGHDLVGETQLSLGSFTKDWPGLGKPCPPFSSSFPSHLCIHSESHLSRRHSFQATCKISLSQHISHVTDNSSWSCTHLDRMDFPPVFVSSAKPAIPLGQSPYLRSWSRWLSGTCALILPPLLTDWMTLGRAF